MKTLLEKKLLLKYSLYLRFYLLYLYCSYNISSRKYLNYLRYFFQLVAQFVPINKSNVSLIRLCSRLSRRLYLLLIVFRILSPLLHGRGVLGVEQRGNDCGMKYLPYRNIGNKLFHLCSFIGLDIVIVWIYLVFNGHS